jgi:hypothetical protein
VEITVIEAGNQPPQFVPIDTIYSVVEGDSLGFLIIAYDVDSDSLTFEFSSLPFYSGYVMLSPDTALFYFTPTYEQAGSYHFWVTIDDGELFTRQDFYIDVLEAGNQPPIFDPIDPQTVYEGDTLSFTISATDVDGTIPPIISVANPQPHAEFLDNGDGTGVYTYLPDYFDSGIDTVIFMATDSDSLQASIEVEITTLEFNITPSIYYLGDSVVVEGHTLVAAVEAYDSTDSDGGPLYLSAPYLPPNSQFVDNGNHTGTFTFTPDFEQTGLDSAMFVVVDAGQPPLSNSIIVHLEVRNVNRAPNLDPLGSYEIDQAETLFVALSATDPDGDTLILRLAENPTPPANCYITDNGNGTGELVFAPDYTQEGIFIINVEAFDLLDSDIEAAFIFVNDLGNQWPTLYPIDDMSLVEGDTVEVLITSSDPDSTPAAIVVEDAPNRAELTDHGDGTATFYYDPLFNEAGTYLMLFMAVDPDGAADSQYVNLEVIEAGNHMPYLGFIADRIVDENDTLIFNVFSDDPDSTVPYIAAEDLPDNADFVDHRTGMGTFSFLPTYFQEGVYTVLFKAIDFEDSAMVDSQFVDITVNNVNQIPVIDSIGPFYIDEGDSLGFLVTAFDPDSTYPILEQESYLLNSAFFDSGNGVGYFSFEPDYFQSGVRNVVFSATDVDDSTAYDDMFVRIFIVDVNRPPVLDSIPADTTIQDGTNLVYNISAEDPDSVIPVLFAHDLPPQSSFNDHGNGNGTFDFNPGFGEIGEYFITSGAIDAVDPALADSQTVRIEVISTGMHPPQFLPVETEYRIEPDSLLVILMQAVDADGPELVIECIDVLPEGAVFVDSGGGIATFNWQPDESDEGLHNLRFVVTDPTDLTDSLEIEIDVITWIRGDANGDGNLSGSDVMYLVAFFKGQVPRPYPEGRGDANGDGQILGNDITYLVRYFKGQGPPPPPGSGGDSGDDDITVITKPGGVNR